MKAIITGASGAVGTALRAHLEQEAATVVVWDRQQISIDDYYAMENFVRHHQPDALFHLATASRLTGRENESWMVNVHWTSELAWVCRQLGVRFLFTSSVMVYSDVIRTPINTSTVPNAAAGYGYEKRQAEERVFAQKPDSVVARLGWQIGDAPGSNNMLDFFERQMRDHGQVNASREWYPACSFLEDTAAALAKLMTGNPGTYLLDANTHWNFYQIASALNEQHGSRWKIVPTDDFVFDQRMIDPRVKLPPLEKRLPKLG